MKIQISRRIQQKRYKKQEQAPKLTPMTKTLAQNLKTIQPKNLLTTTKAQTLNPSLLPPTTWAP